MNIALMSHDRKKELMVQFCIAYCGILSKHTICATNTTGRLVAEATGLPVQLFLSHEHGGSQQIGARIAYNEIDMVLFFSDPQSNDLDADLKYITRLCDQYNIPVVWSGAIWIGETSSIPRPNLLPPKQQTIAPLQHAAPAARRLMPPKAGGIHFRRPHLKSLGSPHDGYHRVGRGATWTGETSSIPRPSLLPRDSDGRPCGPPVLLPESVEKD